MDHQFGYINDLCRNDALRHHRGGPLHNFYAGQGKDPKNGGHSLWHAPRLRWQWPSSSQQSSLLCEENQRQNIKNGCRVDKKLRWSGLARLSAFYDEFWARGGYFIRADQWVRIRIDDDEGSSRSGELGRFLIIRWVRFLILRVILYVIFHGSSYTSISYIDSNDK